jgi:hypothetical protein
MAKQRINIFVIALLALILLAVMPAQAQTIQMSNPNSDFQRDIIIYNSTGSLYGTYNTSSMITIDPNQSYLFVVKPQYTTPLDDPLGYLTSLVSWAQSNAVALFFLACIIGIAFAKGRR